VQQSDDDIIQHLGVHNADMREAMIAIHTRLDLLHSQSKLSSSQELPRELPEDQAEMKQNDQEIVHKLETQRIYMQTNLSAITKRLDLCNSLAEEAATTARNTEQSQAKLSSLRLIDEEVVQQLNAQRIEMQDAMQGLQKNLEDAVERLVLTKGMHALQRRSGHLSSTLDEYLITSFDIIIHNNEKLGGGGFGTVYKADYHGNSVAVKVLDKGVPTYIFQREVDVWKRLRHPNILEFFGACSIADSPFLVCALKSNGDAIKFLHNNPSANRTKLVRPVHSA